MRYRKPFFKRQHGVAVGVASASAAASVSAMALALALALALRRRRPRPRCRRRRWRWHWRCVAKGGVAWRGEAAWRVTLIRTDTTLDHRQKAEKKRDWDITITGNGGTLRGMALALALHRRWRWR